MLTLFLRAIFMYAFVFFILRLTGKRQVADLQPFDLLITLLIADLAGCSIVDTATPLLYSIVPILGMYFVQQLVTHICLKSARARRVICGSPVLLVYDGVVQEQAMRTTAYTLIDLLDALRSNGIFDLSEVAFAVLETNGSMSILPKPAFQPAARGDLGLTGGTAGLCFMLVLDGELCHASMARFSLAQNDVERMIRRFGSYRIRDVFFLHRAPTGALYMQLKARSGGGCFSSEGEA